METVCSALKQKYTLHLPANALLLVLLNQQIPQLFVSQIKSSSRESANAIKIAYYLEDSALLALFLHISPHQITNASLVHFIAKLAPLQLIALIVKADLILLLTSANKFVATVVSLSCHAMMETTLMEMGAPLLVKLSQDINVAEDRQILLMFAFTSVILLNF